jgi:hypothetical protein
MPKVIPTSTNSTLNLKKLNLSEALNLIKLAVQKYPDFALDVSRATSAAESRAKLESIAKFYDGIAREFWEELHREDDWSNYEKQFGGIDSRLLQDLINKVSESISVNSANEVFETAFKCLMLLAGHMTEVEDEDDLFPPDVSDTVQEVQSAMNQVAWLWIKKEGRINEATIKHVLDLVRDDYFEFFDAFREHLLETVQDEDEGQEEDAVPELQGESNRKKRIRTK